MRTHAAIAALIGEAALPTRVTERALGVFRALAEVESTLHRRPVDQVHFHEVGGHDAIIDIVGTAAALEVLGVDELLASAVATGMGPVRSAHGRLPNPAPATVRLLEGVPTYGRDVTVELTTPTGAALVATLCASFGPMPDMTITASGFGGGSNELEDLPNCTQVVIGRADRLRRRAGPAGRGARDQSRRRHRRTARLRRGGRLDAGALDAWVTPVTMKKGRPGHVLHVLSDAIALDDAAAHAWSAPPVPWVSGPPPSHAGRPPAPWKR